MRLPINAIQKHEQLHGLPTCIPSAVEMVLKLLGKVEIGYYDLQREWNPFVDKCFDSFDNKSFFGVKFTKQFSMTRSNAFPLEELFNAISGELAAGRYVIISLEDPPMGWHMYVVFGEENGEYLALTKRDSRTEIVEDVKERVKKMGGTDILTYSFQC